MKYDLNVKLKDLFGKPIIDGETPEGYTLGTALWRAALFTDPESKPTAEIKFKRYELAKKIADAMKGKTAMVDFTTEELAEIKKQVGLLYFPVMLGEIWSILDAHSKAN